LQSKEVQNTLAH
jgi:hypothetical protein